MNKVKEFLKKKDVVLSRQRYLFDAMSGMTLGLFSSLIIGLILKTSGQQIILGFGEVALGVFLVELGGQAIALSGAAIGVGVAWGLKSPPMVLFASIITGTAGYTLGGPAGAFVAASISAEFGKMVSKETKLDIIVTPSVTLLTGMLASKTAGPLVALLMDSIGEAIRWSMARQPFLMGIIVSVIMGAVLTAPISSAALAIMLGLDGLAGGASTAGCSAHMIGFAVISLKANGFSGFVSQGLGTSMLQVPNIIKNPWIILPPVLASAITGPLSTVVFKMTNIPEGAGMGTSGLVGQIGTFTSMGFSADVWMSVALLHFILPAVLSYVFYIILKRAGKFTDNDLKLQSI